MTDIVVIKPPRGELAQAIAQNEIKRAEELLRRGADFTEENTAGWDMLTSAANYGRPEIVRLIISAGANVNRKSHEGVTPLMRAARMGHMEVARMLLEKGADVSLCDSHGLMAQHYAESRDRMEMIALLKEAAVVRERRRASEALHNAAVKKQQGLKGRAPKPVIIPRPKPDKELC